jgi:aldose 1-epimerase
MIRAAALACLVLGLAACARPAPTAPPPVDAVSHAPFGQTANGAPVDLYTLTNAHGVEVKLMTYGAAITSIRTPDRSGAMGQIVLGFDELAPYLTQTAYLGAIVGRYGNRIGKAQFALDGATYQLAANNGVNSLHGGVVGFDKVVWSAEPVDDAEGKGVRFTYVSRDGEEGFPGELTAHVTYQLTDDDELIISYAASTTKATPVNLTNHAYFNLSGDVKRDILGHELTINADAFTPVDAGLITTGEVRAVAGTPFDFRAPAAIGARIGADDEQLRFGLGYDHNWVLNKPAPGALATAARLSDPESGRVLEVRTTEPGLQFYSGNFLDGSATGRGVAFAHRWALCLETQHFPDSPNKPDFPSTILRPGETYRSQTVLAFSAQ